MNDERQVTVETKCFSKATQHLRDISIVVSLVDTIFQGASDRRDSQRSISRSQVRVPPCLGCSDNLIVATHPKYREPIGPEKARAGALGNVSTRQKPRFN